MKRIRGKLRHPVPIGSLLDDVLGAYRLYADQDLVRVWELWESVVGESIAAQAQPAGFKDRLLLVHTRSSAWIHQLRFNKKELIARLNVALGNELIGDIRFRIGPVDSSGGFDENR